jgi:hypothetical protein
VYFDGEDAESVLRTHGQWVEELDERTSTSVVLIRHIHRDRVAPQCVSKNLDPGNRIRTGRPRR